MDGRQPFSPSDYCLGIEGEQDQRSLGQPATDSPLQEEEEKDVELDEDQRIFLSRYHHARTLIPRGYKRKGDIPSL
jgi:hypothetical protein